MSSRTPTTLSSPPLRSSSTRYSSETVRFLREVCSEANLSPARGTQLIAFLGEPRPSRSNAAAPRTSKQPTRVSSVKHHKRAKPPAASFKEFLLDSSKLQTPSDSKPSSSKAKSSQSDLESIMKRRRRDAIAESGAYERDTLPPAPENAKWKAVDPGEKDALAFKMTFRGREPPSEGELRRRAEERRRNAKAEEGLEARERRLNELSQEIEDRREFIRELGRTGGVAGDDRRKKQRGEFEQQVRGEMAEKVEEMDRLLRQKMAVAE